MFSASLADDTGTMRPGLISGRYPEQADRELRLMDLPLGQLWEGLTRRFFTSSAGLRKIAAEIGRQGPALAGLERTGLDRELLELRRRLRRRGLNHQLCIRAFALIREFSARTLHMRHYDSQLMGAWVMLRGRLAEMETGEGKTLAATLAAATAALAGIPVHVITVNEYLVERDARLMAPLYRALGLTVGCVTQTMTTEERRAGYACHITYCTNKQVAFDYLRDRLMMGNTRSMLRLQLESAYADDDRLGRLLLRGLCFAIVDEADSVLIDEARTPLILTRSMDSAQEHQSYQQALQLARELENQRDFYLDPGGRGAQLSLAGQRKLARLPLCRDGLWKNPRRREELVCQALHALHLLCKDRDYLVSEDKVVIIDANTGRTMADRSWERGLHQMVEAKEGCPLTDAREHLGRLTYQRFFRRYLHLGGMTGTASELSSELWSVYGLRVQLIPLHRPSRRRELPTRVYATAEDKWAAVIAAVTRRRNRGQPVLIGTASVADSELLSRKLTAGAIAHQVLNARQDKEEARIVAAAGRPGQVTVATNMAGRGTDIPLAQGVAELGGLHVLAACRNESKRVDRQLYGRCARQGDPGSHQTIVSLDDEMVRRNGRPSLIRFLGRHWPMAAGLRRKLNLFIIRRAQQQIERRHREARRALLRHDRNTDRLLAFSGHSE
jgi:preprotein translocase subunit SecA